MERNQPDIEFPGYSGIKNGKFLFRAATFQRFQSEKPIFAEISKKTIVT